jgi:hypothetical protein
MPLPISSTIRKIVTQMCAAQRNSFTISNTPNVLPNHLLREWGRKWERVEREGDEDGEGETERGREERERESKRGWRFEKDMLQKTWQQV